MIVRNFDSVESYEIQYAGGERYPQLEQIPGSHDYLSEILSPRSYKEHWQRASKGNEGRHPGRLFRIRPTSSFNLEWKPELGCLT